MGKQEDKLESELCKILIKSLIKLLTILIQIDDHPNNKEKFIPFLRSLEASPLLQLESIELGQRSSGVH